MIHILNTSQPSEFDNHLLSMIVTHSYKYEYSIIEDWSLYRSLILIFYSKCKFKILFKTLNAIQGSELALKCTHIAFKNICKPAPVK